MNTQNTRRAFTLIEMLVVVTIIGLLAALLFPVFAKVRENGRRTSCLSNERQIGLALLQYTADNDAYFPNAFTPHNAGDWALQVFPYVKDPAVYRCPDDPTLDGELNFPLPVVHYFVDSYAINSNLQGPPVSDFTPTGDIVRQILPSFSESVLAAPTKTVMLFEAQDDAAALTTPSNEYMGCAASGSGGDPATPGSPWVGGCRPAAGFVSATPLYATGAIGGRVPVYSQGNFGLLIGGLEATDPRHGAGANYLACDGHAVWLRPESVSGGKSQPPGGANCGQDDAGALCSGGSTAAGTANSRYALTFSVR